MGAGAGRAVINDRLTNGWVSVVGAIAVVGAGSVPPLSVVVGVRNVVAVGVVVCC